MAGKLCDACLIFLQLCETLLSFGPADAARLAGQVRSPQDFTSPPCGDRQAPPWQPTRSPASTGAAAAISSERPPGETMPGWRQPPVPRIHQSLSHSVYTCPG